MNNHSTTIKDHYLSAQHISICNDEHMEYGVYKIQGLERNSSCLLELVLWANHWAVSSLCRGAAASLLTLFRCLSSSSSYFWGCNRRAEKTNFSHFDSWILFFRRLLIVHERMWVLNSRLTYKLRVLTQQSLFSYLDRQLQCPPHCFL